MIKRFCNKCGKEIKENEDGLSLWHCFGYDSKYDCKKLNTELCSECTDELVDTLVRTCKYNPIIGNL